MKCYNTFKILNGNICLPQKQYKNIVVSFNITLVAFQLLITINTNIHRNAQNTALCIIHLDRMCNTMHGFR